MDSLFSGSSPMHGVSVNPVVLVAGPSGELNAQWRQAIALLRPALSGLSVAVVNTSWTEQPSKIDLGEEPGEIRVDLSAFISQPKTPEALQSYDEFLENDDFQHFRFIALKLLNRSDLTGTFRLIDREIYLSNYIISAFEFLRSFSPKVVVFDVTPHGFPEWVVWKVAEWLGITVLFFQPCPVAPVMFPRTTISNLLLVPEANVESSPHSDYLLAIARSRLQLLESGVDPRYMESQKHRDALVSRKRHKFAAIRASLGWLFKDRFPESIDFSGHGHRQGILSRALKVLLVRSLQNSLRKKVLGLETASTGVGDYCVFALHYEPERTSIPDGLPVDFQANAVLKARRFMPTHFSLVVKEHYSQTTSALRGFLGRSPLFYDFVKSLPSTTLSNPNERLSDLLARAKCVFTLTGTVAIEAAFRGVPVIYFGNPWWAGLPGTFRFDSLASFDDVGKATMPGESQARSFLLELVAKRAIPGLPDGSAQIGVTPEERPGFEDEVARSLAACLVAAMRE